MATNATVQIQAVAIPEFALGNNHHHPIYSFHAVWITNYCSHTMSILPLRKEEAFSHTLAQDNHC